MQRKYMFLAFTVVLRHHSQWFAGTFIKQIMFSMGVVCADCALLLTTVVKHATCFCLNRPSVSYSVELEYASTSLQADAVCLSGVTPFNSNMTQQKASHCTCISKRLLRMLCSAKEEACSATEEADSAHTQEEEDEGVKQSAELSLQLPKVSMDPTMTAKLAYLYSLNQVSPP